MTYLHTHRHTHRQTHTHTHSHTHSRYDQHKKSSSTHAQREITPSLHMCRFPWRHAVKNNMGDGLSRAIPPTWLKHHTHKHTHTRTIMLAEVCLTSTYREQHKHTHTHTHTHCHHHFWHDSGVYSHPPAAVYTDMISDIMLEGDDNKTPTVVL